MSFTFSSLALASASHSAYSLKRREMAKAVLLAIYCLDMASVQVNMIFRKWPQASARYVSFTNSLTAEVSPLFSPYAESLNVRMVPSEVVRSPSYVFCSK